MNGGDEGRRSDELARRRLLTAVATAAVTAGAGCTVSFEDGIRVDFGGDGESSTPTDHGYGGTPTATATSTTVVTTTNGREGASDEPSTTTHTPTAGGTTTHTSTEASTTTPTPEDDYGVQGYGEYGYGG